MASHSTLLDLITSLQVDLINFRLNVDQYLEHSLKDLKILDEVKFLLEEHNLESLTSEWDSTLLAVRHLPHAIVAMFTMLQCKHCMMSLLYYRTTTFFIVGEVLRQLSVAIQPQAAIQLQSGGGLPLSRPATAPPQVSVEAIDSVMDITEEDLLGDSLGGEEDPLIYEVTEEDGDSDIEIVWERRQRYVSNN